MRMKKRAIFKISAASCFGSHPLSLRSLDPRCNIALSAFDKGIREAASVAKLSRAPRFAMTDRVTVRGSSPPLLIARAGKNARTVSRSYLRYTRSRQEGRTVDNFHQQPSVNPYFELETERKIALNQPTLRTRDLLVSLIIVIREFDNAKFD